MRSSLPRILLGALLGVALHAPVTAQNAGAPDPAFDGDGRLDIKLVAGNTDSAKVMVNYPDRRVLAAGQCTDATGTTACLTRFNEDGSPDASFGTGGKLVAQLVSGYRITVTGLALQSDGKILLSARCDAVGGNSQPCHARLQANGQLDSGYGNSGSVVAVQAAGAGNGSASGVAVQSDGKIVVGGHCIDTTTFGLCAWRYNSNGTIDATYGTAGTARVVVTPNSFGTTGFLLTADNAAIVIGYCDYNPGGSTAQFCLVRFSAGGVRDTAYVGGAGAPTLPHHTTGSVYEYPMAAVLQADGAVVLAGTCGSGGSFQFCTIRVAANGAVDSSFGGGWVKPANANLGSSSEATGMALQRDGKLVYAVACADRFHVCSARLNSDGSFDQGYGTGGVKAVTVGGFATEVGGALLDLDERLLIAGGCFGNDGGGITDSCFWRLQRGESYAGRSCSLDVDDDGVVLSANDVLIMTRAAMGFSGSAALAGITLAPAARRTSWTAMRDYLVNQCGMARVR